MKKSIYVVLIILFFAGCAKEKTNDTDNNPIITLADNAIWINEQTNQVLQLVDSFKLVYSGNTAQLQNLKINNIIVSGIVPNAPYGYLRKIVAIQKSGNQYTLITADVPFNEAFKELHVNHTKDFTAEDTITGKKESVEFNVDFDNLVIYDGGSPSKRVTLNGSISFTPSLKVLIDINAFKLDYAKLEASFVTTIGQQLTVGGNLGSFSKEVLVYKQPLTPFTIPFTPIVIVPFLVVNVGADGIVSVQVDASCTHENTVTAYMEMKNDVWESGYNYTAQNTYNFSGVNGSLSAKAFIEPALEFKFYGSNWGKVALRAQGYLKFNANMSPATCSLKAGVNASADANVSIFGFTVAQIEYPEIFKYEKLLYTCNTVATLGYNCTGGTCSYVSDGAQYSTLSDCQQDCSAPTPGYNCIGGTCQYVADGADYSLITDCQNNCTLPTNSCSGIIDVVFDGFTYHAVAIGNQCWLKENLTTMYYANGDLIPFVSDNTDWNQNNSSGAWARYNDDVQLEQSYGKLYNWYAVSDSRNVCPVGWHVPSEAEWSTLVTYAGGSSSAGAALKESGNATWVTAGGSNQFGLSALPGGYRTEVSAYTKINEAGWWWSSTGSLSNGKMISMNHDVNSTLQLNTDKRKGLSVRCVKD
jgi:uncharacterized protein (TIGR02145 family)